MFDSDLKIVSRTGKLHTASAPIYRLLSDFSFLNQVQIPDERVKIQHSNNDTCTLHIEGGGEFTLKIVERVPTNLVKIEADKSSSFAFTLWIQLKELEAYDTRIRITLTAKLNPLMKIIAQKHLENFVEMLISKLEQHFGPNTTYNNRNYEA